MNLIVFIISYYFSFPAHFVASLVINNTSIIITTERQRLKSSITTTPNKIIKKRSGIGAHSDVDSEQQHQDHLWNKFSALTLATKDMNESVKFYQKLGLVTSYRSNDFTTLHPPPKDTVPHMASIYMNLILRPDYDAGSSWGRIVVYVSDVDAMFERVLQQGFQPEFSPRNAPWGERYFHILDPSGHELSFAKPLE